MPDREMTYEEAIARLEKIVEEMENQEIPLDRSLALYKEGAGLARFCRQKLASARHELEIWQAGEEEGEEDMGFADGDDDL